jgi:mannose-6-phosphate isomerase-like protein (cupin superfamily)
VADTFHLVDVLEQLQASGRPYYEFLQRASLSAGVYHLPAGEPDPQRPHTEDEVYYVLSGEGAVEIAGEVTRVRPGSVVFVEKHVPHRFLDYDEGITLLVIFAPPRGSQA